MDTNPVNSIILILNSIGGAQNDEKQRRELLENLKTGLANFSRAQMADQVDQLSLDILFECLGHDIKDEVDITCGILKDLMLVSDPLRNLEKYHEAMLQGFEHPSGEVRALVIAQLLRCVEAGGSALTVLCNEHHDLLIATVRQQGGEDLSVAKAAGLFLMKLAATEAGSSFLLGRAGTDTLKQVIGGPGVSEAIKFRVYETLAHIANISERNLTAIENQSMLITPLCHVAFESDDPLGQMNALEIMAILAESKQGLAALAASDVFPKVKRLSQDWKNNPLSNLLFPGILKFVGRVGAQQVPPEELVTMVIEAIVNSERDIPLATVGIEAFAYIGSTQEGKLHLDRELRLRSCFSCIRDILENSAAEFRCRVLEALSYLFGSDEENTTFLPRWFGFIFPQISVLFNLVQLPFMDIRLKALNFLASIAHLEWAQKHYLRSPGVIEFLTDRNAEPDKDCALAKFKIVSIIVDSATPTTLKILSPENMARLRVHLKQGPFYAPAQATVAFEGSS